MAGPLEVYPNPIGGERLGHEIGTELHLDRSIRVAAYSSDVRATLWNRNGKI
jgi:hypothetical protein